jgi:hypothetical protein
MSQYDCKIIYIKGESNTVADVLSRTKFADDPIAQAKRPYESTEDMVAMVVCPPFLTMVCAQDLADTCIMDNIDTIGATISITTDNELLDCICSGYGSDLWCQQIDSAKFPPYSMEKQDGLWYCDKHLLIPCMQKIHKLLFHLAHDILGHFRFEKSYGFLQDLFYWPNMRQDLEKAYVPGCANCQCNKSNTTKPYGLLHPLSIPD